jgi:soluble lytic murein transglycosylase-like protein
LEFALLFLTTSLSLGLPPFLLDSVCWQESRHNPKAYRAHDGNSTPSYGICQIKLKTARHMGYQGRARDLMSPTVNIYWAGRYLRYQLKRYKGNVTRALVAYNSGRSKTKHGNSYSSKVLKRYRYLKQAEAGRAYARNSVTRGISKPIHQSFRRQH